MTRITFAVPKLLRGVFPEPVMAAKKMPEYFKTMSPDCAHDAGMGTAKRCIPFIEAMSQGYIIPLWADLKIIAKDGDIRMSFPPTDNVGADTDIYMWQCLNIQVHEPEQLPSHPRAHETYGRVVPKIVSPWIVATEKGYSCLFTKPLNHMDTRFQLFDAVVDTDSYYSTVNFPFIWTGGEGNFIIPKGTPFVQVIPFKRQDYTMEITDSDDAKFKNTQYRIFTVLKNRYRKLFWHKRKSEDS
jgi:hypothetical protein